MPWHGRRSRIASEDITRGDEEGILAFCKRLVHRLPGTVVMKPPAIIAHGVRGAVSDQISRLSEAEKLRWSDGPLTDFFACPEITQDLSWPRLGGAASTPFATARPCSHARH